MDEENPEISRIHQFFHKCREERAKSIIEETEDRPTANSPNPYAQLFTQLYRTKEHNPSYDSREPNN